jgi:hypothetical protein
MQRFKSSVQHVLTLTPKDARKVNES